MERTIAVSSGCTTSVGACITTRPRAATTRSIGMSPATAVREAIKTPRLQTVARAEAGGAAASSAAEGDWNSSRTAAAASADARDCRRKLNMAGYRSLCVTVLLQPKLTVDGAAFEEIRVRAEVRHASLIQDENGVAVDKGGEAV